MTGVRRFASEGLAARFYLETRAICRRSLTDYERRAGCPRSEGDAEDRALRGILPVDAQATHRAIERALVGFPAEWRGVLLVCLGWGALVEPPEDEPAKGIRHPSWFAKIDPPLPASWCRLPEEGLTRHHLWTRRQQFRAALAREGVLDAEEVEAWERVEAGKYDDGGPVAPGPGDDDGGGEMAEAEKPLVGWKAIAGYLGCSVSTAQRYEAEGMPVCRVGKLVRVFPSTLRVWLDGQRERATA
jgi:hypothetical protein